MTKRRLADILKWQWWLHTATTSLFFICATFFFLFTLEDKLYEDQLSHIADIIKQNGPLAHLPAHIQVHAFDEIPTAWQEQLTTVGSNQAIEVYNEKAVAIHLILANPDNGQSPFVLALDTSLTPSIWAISDKILLLMLPWIVLFLILASILAGRFTKRIQQHFSQLLTLLKKSDTPAPLLQFSSQQSIDELASFAQLFAQDWQQKLDILAREKQALNYLSHELRTPLQSSSATLELLALKIEDQQHINRLSRSLNRMTRLSNTILCLMESTKPMPAYPVDVLAICQNLLDEIQPLAKTKKQTIELQRTGDKPFVLQANEEVVETILSILLTNALTHSNNKPIIVTVESQQVTITNETYSDKQGNDNQGFGIGLKIAQRLADKFDLSVDLSFDTQKKAIAAVYRRSSHQTAMQSNTLS